MNIFRSHLLDENQYKYIRAHKSMNNNKHDIDMNNETLKKINSINDNLLMIKQVQINDLENDKSPLDIPFRKMNDIQRCKVLFEIYFS